jgi:FkbM family methyltransferase
MNINYNDIISRNNPNILDVGAFDGTHSLKFANEYPEGKIFSFEADPDVCEIFEKNINLYDLPNNNITLIKKAVGDKNGTLIFNRAIDSEERRTGSSGTFLTPTKHLQLHPHVAFRQIEVDCITLDSWFENEKLDYIDLAWTDVNGAEMALLRGGQNTFKATKYLQLECISWALWKDQPTKNELLDLIPNFEIIHDEHTDMLLKNKELV